MAKKGETLSPELRARMAEAQRLSALRKRVEKARKAAQAPADPLEDLEDGSLPLAPRMPDPAEPPPPPIEGDPTDPYNVWLTVLEPETRAMFSEKELRELWAERQEQAAAEKKTRKRKEISDLALSTARSSLGLLPAQKVEQMRVAQLNARRMKVLVQMPPAQDNGLPADVGLRIDGKIYENGKIYDCSYAEAASFREILYRHGQHELQFKGQNLRYRSYLLGQAMGSLSNYIDLQQRNGTWQQ